MLFCARGEQGHSARRAILPLAGRSQGRRTGEKVMSRILFVAASCPCTVGIFDRSLVLSTHFPWLSIALLVVADKHSDL